MQLHAPSPDSRAQLHVHAPFSSLASWAQWAPGTHQWNCSSPPSHPPLPFLFLLVSEMFGSVRMTPPTDEWTHGQFGKIVTRWRRQLLLCIKWSCYQSMRMTTMSCWVDRLAKRPFVHYFYSRVTHQLALLPLTVSCVCVSGCGMGVVFGTATRYCNPSF